MMPNTFKVTTVCGSVSDFCLGYTTCYRPRKCCGLLLNLALDLHSLQCGISALLPRGVELISRLCNPCAVEQLHLRIGRPSCEVS